MRSLTSKNTCPSTSDSTLQTNMDYLQIIGLILMAPLTIVVVAMNMAKTEARRLRKLKERADRKRKTR